MFTIRVTVTANHLLIKHFQIADNYGRLYAPSQLPPPGEARSASLGNMYTAVPPSTAGHRYSNHFLKITISRFNSETEYLHEGTR